MFVWFISHQPAVLFSQNKSATSNQPTVFFSQNKSAPAISHQPNESSYIYSWGVHERKIIWFLKEESPRITFQSTIAKV
jgi:hypothetical protein